MSGKGERSTTQFGDSRENASYKSIIILMLQTPGRMALPQCFVASTLSVRVGKRAVDSGGHVEKEGRDRKDERTMVERVAKGACWSRARRSPLLVKKLQRCSLEMLDSRDGGKVDW